METLLKCFPSPPFWKFFKKLPTHFTPLCKLTTVSKYGKLQSFPVQSAMGVQLGFMDPVSSIFLNLRIF